MDYSLADLTKLTGAKRRTVQLWAEAGVIQADKSTERAGTGVHRRFDRDEAKIACLIHGLSRGFQMPIGVILRISTLLRSYIADPRFQELLEQAINTEDGVFLILRGSGSPDFVISLADGGTHFEFSIAVIDQKRVQSEEEFFGLIAKRTIEALDHFGSTSLTIRANTCLAPLR